MIGSASDRNAAAGSIAGPDEVFTHEKISLYDSPYSYLLLVVGFAGFFVLAFVKGKGGAKMAIGAASMMLFLLLLSGTNAGNRQTIADGTSAFERGDYKEALLSFQKVLNERKDLPYLRYDIALCFLEENKIPASLFELYHALHSLPADRKIKGVIEEIEKDAGLFHQYPAVPAIDPDLPFILSLITFTAMAFLFGFFVRTKNNAFLVCTICVLTLFVTCSSFSGYYMNIASKSFGIVKESGGGWKKIPIEDFQEEKKVPAGTLVCLFGAANGYVLAETGEGQRGWIKENELLIEEGLGWYGLRKNTE
jgi:hypothetical protein